MSIELLLVIIFVAYHLGFASVLSLLIVFCERVVGWKLQPVLAHNLWFAAFVVSVVAPIILTGIHACNFIDSGAQQTGWSNPAFELGLVTNSNTAIAADSQNLLFQGSLTSGISNTENFLYLFDLLAYVFWPVINFLAILLPVGVAVGLVRLLRLSVMTIWLVRGSKQVVLPPSLHQKIKFPVAHSHKIGSPMAVGIFVQRILLPTNLLGKLSSEQLYAVLIHEQAHHQRGDLPMSLGLRLSSTLYWWSLPLRFIHKQIKQSRETVCDHQAAGEVGDRLTYAQALLDCAKLLVPGRRAYIAVELTGRESQLSHRITSLLNDFQPQKYLTTVLVVSTCVISLASIQAVTALDSQLHKDDLLRLTRQYQLHADDVGPRLLEAILKNDTKSLDELVAEGVNINLPIQKEGHREGTALMAAVRSGNLVMVETLLGHGADPNQAAARRGNPLIYAAILGDQSIAQALLDAGADVNGVVPRDETPLIKASRYGQTEMVEFLVEKGARVNLGVRTSWGDNWEYRTPLNRASSTEIQNYLLSVGAT